MRTSPKVSGERPERKILGFSRNVFFLALVSLLQDVSGEMIFTIMPLFLANVLGVKVSIIGLIEGVADTTATLSKPVGGWVSDRLKRRKGLTVLGYLLSTIAKPFLYFATNWGVVLGIRFVDRVGKGVRTAPRDALLAASSPPDELGRSFGFHRAADTMGAVLGVAGAAAIVFLLQGGSLELTRDTYQMLVLVGVIPAIITVLMLVALVRDVPRGETGSGAVDEKAGPVPGQRARQGVDRRFKVFLGIMVLFPLGNSSDAFLLLRAQNLGLSVFQILVVLVLFNLVYSLSAMPAGILSDRFGRRRVITFGWVVYALIYLGFAFASSAWEVWALFVVYGLYYGATEGVARALVADIVPDERRGTAFGLYHGAVGITALPASVIAGFLWQIWGPGAPFLFGAGLAGLATLGLVALVRR